LELSCDDADDDADDDDDADSATDDNLYTTDDKIMIN